MYLFLIKLVTSEQMLQIQIQCVWKDAPKRYRLPRYTHCPKLKNPFQTGYVSKFVSLRLSLLNTWEGLILFPILISVFEMKMAIYKIPGFPGISVVSQVRYMPWSYKDSQFFIANVFFELPIKRSHFIGKAYILYPNCCKLIAIFVNSEILFPLCMVVK